ncbi:hypothetical protein GCM10022282_09370 [Agromyces indicus]
MVAPGTAIASPTAAVGTATPAAAVPVVAAETATDARIAGTVVGVHGSPLSAVTVRLHRIDGSGMIALNSRTTDTTGTFSFSGLAAGDYTLEFTPKWESNHLQTWWGGAAAQAEAVPIRVGASEQVTGLRAELRPGAVVTGVLTDEHGAPLVGHVVALLGASSCQAVLWEQSLAGGVFRFSGLEPGTYSLYFWNGGPDERTFIGEYWRDQPECDLVDRFELAQGQVLGGMDVELSTRRVELRNPTFSPSSPSVGVPLTVEAASPTPGVVFDYQWGAGYVAIPGATGPTLTPSAEHLGKSLYVRITAHAPGFAPVLLTAYAGTVEPPPPPLDWGPVVRLSGPDRYATSVAVSRSQFAPGVDTVFIASGAAFPDALSGAGVAASRNGPLLLTPAAGLPQVVIDEIKRLKPKMAIIFGGTGAVSSKVQQQLYELTNQHHVARFSGSDRYATSVAISRMEYSPLAPPVVYVANGMDFPDALSGAPLAGRERGPLLLSTATALPSPIAAELDRLNPQRIVILGGTGSISDAVARQLGTYTSGGVTRLAGADRYQTSAAISKGSFDVGVPVAYIANGANFPDALSGAPVAGMQGGPVLLTPASALPEAVVDELQRLRPERVVILGGTGSVSSAVQQQLDGLG